MAETVLWLFMQPESKPLLVFPASTSSLSIAPCDEHDASAHLSAPSSIKYQNESLDLHRNIVSHKLSIYLCPELDLQVNPER